MKPASPVVPGLDLPERLMGEDQPEYITLPAYRYDDGDVLTRWRCSFLDRLRILFTGNVYVYVKTFGKPMSPLMLQSEKPTCKQ